jgi:RimJ/RimL family protein N-acetyltransferase
VIELRPVDASIRHQVLALRPLPEQAAFSGVAAQTLPRAERHAHHQPIAILRDGEPVGFFVLDTGPEVRQYLAAPGVVGVRAFFIDRRHQRQGIGTQALTALPTYLRHHHPAAEAVALTVNTKNPWAIHVYRKAGFRDTGDLYLGGGLGPQLVLVLDLL